MEVLEAWPLLRRLSGCWADEKEEDAAEETAEWRLELDGRGHSTDMAIFSSPLALKWTGFALGEECGVATLLRTAESSECGIITGQLRRTEAETQR